MCSLGDDNIEDIENAKFMPQKEKITDLKCNKCREATPIVLLRSKDKYCKECFLTGTVHKFRALLGKHKLIKPNDQVLIVHKCGHQSTALLQFLRTGIDLETHKKIRFKPIVLFIEDGVEYSLAERKEILQKVQTEVSNFNFTLYFTSFVKQLELGFDGNNLKTDPNELELKDDDKINLDKKLNLTNRFDFLYVVRREFLIKIANFLNCAFIFTLEVSSDIASHLLTDITLGRGSHIALNSGFCDDRNESVRILRPLRLFDLKELAFYNYLHQLEPVTCRFLDTNSYNSIQSLMNKFVCDLQMNYPATVTTILKTGDKLQSVRSTKKCDFCKAPISVEKQEELDSSEATQFSHCVSTHKFDKSLTSQERYNQALKAFSNLTCEKFCYSCRNLMK